MKHLHFNSILISPLESAAYITLDFEGLGARRRALFSFQNPGDESDASIGKKLLDPDKSVGIGLPLSPTDGQGT